MAKSPREFVEEAIARLPPVDPPRPRCVNCNGLGYRAVPTTHPTNPMLDGWDRKTCIQCHGSGFGKRPRWMP